ncbi:helix-turn-helix domain-containing protein, partial [Streptomyces acidiscabies]|uniref:helix-turn-helix domain-containing protein n=1 Tax=Streptomyces acidiscabies TaxID=42234 RepID=UPI000AF3822C
MTSGRHAADFAERLRELKSRTDRSYGSLARRLGMNTSTLHRYCAGEAVPQDFAPVERLAGFCGASSAERLELHRLWLLAVEERQGRQERGRKGHHHHLVCRICGKAVEVEGPAVEKWAEAIAAEHGYVSVAHTVE